MPRRLKGVSVLALALLPALAGALGLGGIRGDSALNEPFLARIELNGVAPGELDGVKVILASEAEFTKAGSPRSDFLTGLIFVPEVSPEGKVQVRVTSTKPIREPYLDFLV
ncbi:MAG: pilus assembly protein FimV, partial [Chromatiaceae bacterium]|nr:pilus assembly protein FimV [Chromatiaceae bacterium]